MAKRKKKPATAKGPRRKKRQDTSTATKAKVTSPRPKQSPKLARLGHDGLLRLSEDIKEAERLWFGVAGRIADLHGMAIEGDGRWKEDVTLLSDDAVDTADAFGPLRRAFGSSVVPGPPGFLISGDVYDPAVFDPREPPDNHDPSKPWNPGSFHELPGGRLLANCVFLTCNKYLGRECSDWLSRYRADLRHRFDEPAAVHRELVQQQMEWLASRCRAELPRIEEEDEAAPSTSPDGFDERDLFWWKGTPYQITVSHDYCRYLWDKESVLIVDVSEDVLGNPRPTKSQQRTIEQAIRRLNDHLAGQEPPIHLSWTCSLRSGRVTRE